jgi:hypothetical protein
MTSRSHKVVLNRRRLAQPARSSLGVSVKLDSAAVPAAPADGAEVAPVWVQVTAEGDFRGYSGGRFKFDRATFDTIIANFHNHPSYVAGADGVGIADVVPWDFHHASEYAPTEGTIPATGAPAQGWVRELAVRQGPDGDELWALTRWLEPARSYIKAGQYKWASVVVDFGTRDPRSGEKVGATLVSVAITNNPFVEGMAPLVAASRQRVAAGNYIGGMYCEPACSAEDALDKLRQVLGLPATRPVGEVMAEIMKLQEWVMNGSAPMGVEVDELLGAFRMILNLPALSSNDEVFAEAGKLLQRLLDAADVNISDPGAQAPPPANNLPPDAAAMSRRTNMNLLKILAAKLGVQENDAAVEKAIEDLLQFRTVLCQIAGVSETVSNRKLLEADAGKSVADVRGKLTAILGALGLDEASAGEAINKLAQVMEQSAKLKEVMPELEGLRAEQAKQEEEAVEKDVDAAMATKGIKDDAVRTAFIVLRRTDKEAFFKANPKSAPTAAASGAQVAHLTQQVATTGAGGEQRLELTADGKVRVLKPVLGKKPEGEGRISLSAFAGRNAIEKTIAYLRANGHKDAKHDDVWALACQLVRDGKVEDAA